jgi:hypothetical protein
LKKKSSAAIIIILSLLIGCDNPFFELLLPSIMWKITLPAVQVGGKVEAYRNDLSVTGSYAGNTVTIKILPAAGYKLDADSFEITGVPGGDIEEVVAGKEYTFIMPEDDVYVKASFEAILAEAITVDPKEGIVVVNDEEGLQLTATVLPANALDKRVTWTSSDTSIATVSNTGLVKGITRGYVDITVTLVSNDKIYAKAAITVGNPTPTLAPKISTPLDIRTNGGTSQKITWSYAGDKGSMFAGYYIYRLNAKNDPVSKGTRLNTQPTKAEQWTDEKVPANADVWYKVTAINVESAEGPASSAAESIHPAG